jgi:hypothetical protein
MRPLLLSGPTSLPRRLTASTRPHPNGVVTRHFDVAPDVAMAQDRGPRCRSRLSASDHRKRTPKPITLKSCSSFIFCSASDARACCRSSQPGFPSPFADRLVVTFPRICSRLIGVLRSDTYIMKAGVSRTLCIGFHQIACYRAGSLR